MTLMQWEHVALRCREGNMLNQLPSSGHYKEIAMPTDNKGKTSHRATFPRGFTPLVAMVLINT